MATHKSDIVNVNGQAINFRDVAKIFGQRGDTQVTLVFNDGRELLLDSYPGEGLYDRVQSAFLASRPRPTRPTVKTATATLRTLGITLRKVDGEYRVNYKGGSEETAYYTNDVQDAVDTGRAMARPVARVLADNVFAAIAPNTRAIVEA